MKQLIAVFTLLFLVQFSFSQNDEQLIRETLNNYIEGSTNGKPHLLKKAFHPDLNLYYVKKFITPNSAAPEDTFVLN